MRYCGTARDAQILDVAGLSDGFRYISAKLAYIAVKFVKHQGCVRACNINEYLTFNIGASLNVRHGTYHLLRNKWYQEWPSPNPKAV